MDTVNDGVHWVQNTLSNYDFTIAEGIDFLFSPSIFQYDLMFRIACDSMGSFVAQFTFGEAVTTGTPSVAVQMYYSVTNAPSVDELKGFGVSLWDL